MTLGGLLVGRETMAFLKPRNYDNSRGCYHRFSPNCVGHHAGTLRGFGSHLQWDDGRWERERIAFPEGLPWPSHGAASFIEHGLLYPSQQP